MTRCNRKRLAEAKDLWSTKALLFQVKRDPLHVMKGFEVRKWQENL